MWNERDPRGEEREAEALLDSIAGGDRTARGRLFERYRPRLLRLVGARLDRRIRPRSDPSDIVQDAMAVADRRLDDYIVKRPMPLFSWLYVLTRDQIGKARRRLTNPVVPPAGASETSIESLENLPADSATGPCNQAIRNEVTCQVREAIERLSSDHRQVLLMRYVENRKFAEIACILGIGPGAVRMRHLRAIEEMRRYLTALDPGGGEHRRATSMRGGHPERPSARSSARPNLR